MDQIRGRSVGLPPVTGVDAEIGRDPLPPRVVSTGEPPDLLAAHHRHGRLALDIDQAGVRAVLALFAQLKDVEAADGSWNGGNVVAILSAWFARPGIDPDRPVDQLDGHLFSADRSCSELVQGSAADGRPEDEGVPDASVEASGFPDVDLDRIAELVRADGIDCISRRRAVGSRLLAFAPAEQPVWASPWAVQAGPGRFGGDERYIASTRDLRVGADPADRDQATLGARAWRGDQIVE